MIYELLSKYKCAEDFVDFASSQGVAGILFDEYINIHTTKGEKILDRKDFLKLSVLVDYCQKGYNEHVKAIEKLSKFYAKHGISMMLLKGCGLSFDWPKPNLRPCGDIDIFLFQNGKCTQKRGDELLNKVFGIKIDEGHEHHTNFFINELSVENHYDFINVKGHRDAPYIEKKLKELAFEKCRKVNMPLSEANSDNRSQWILPSSDFNALFLLRHMGQHFAGSEMTLRQMYDWGFFMDKHSSEIDWKRMLSIYNEIGISEFFHQINAICVDYLGFNEDKFPNIERKKNLEKRILDDVFQPEFNDEKPKGNLCKVLLFKNRRYWANAWKRKLIFRDSPFVDFFYGSFAHLLKWKTIKEY